MVVVVIVMVMGTRESFSKIYLEINIVMVAFSKRWR